MEKNGAKSTLILCFLVALLYEEIEADLGGTCVTNADCANGICDTTRTTSICALGDTDACVAPNADKCVLNAECTTDTCSCKTGYTAAGKLCIGALGSECETSTGCGENDVCDTAANSATCVLDLGGSCVTNDDCTKGVCDTTRTTSICALGDTDTCVAPNADKCVLKAECTTDTCSCKTGYTAAGKLCIGALGSECETSTGCGENEVCDTAANPATCVLDLGGSCVTNDDCTTGVCDTTRTTSICALGDTYACAAPNAGNCLLNAECTTDTCSCKTGYTAAGKLCIGALGSPCEKSTGCGEHDVCDKHVNPAKCALATGGNCDVDDSKCMTHSECTAETCTCTFGDADETTELCPAPSSGLRESCSMLGVLMCLWLSQL